MRVINFSHGDFVVLGVYSAIVIYAQLGWDPLLSLVVALPLAFLLGMGLERLVLSRLEGAPAGSTLLATLGLSLVIQNVLLLTFGSATVQAGPVTLTLAQLLAGAVVLLVIVGLYLFLTFTERGRAVRATSQNWLGAELVGIDTKVVSSLVFGLGVALSVAARMILIPQLFVTPVVTGPVFTLKAFVVTVLGGLGNVSGATGVISSPPTSTWRSGGG